MKNFLTAFVLIMLSATSEAQLMGNRLNRGRTPRMPSPPLQDASKTPADENAEPSDLNFNQTPSDLVFETYGRMVGRTILKDPATPSATITLKSEPGQKLSKEEQIEATKGMIENIVFSIPNGWDLERFNDLAESIQLKIECLKESITETTEARDRLLPKLMSGELEV